MAKFYKIMKEIYIASGDQSTIKSIENLDLSLLGHIENHSGEVTDYKTVVEEVTYKQLPTEVKEHYRE